MSKLSKFLCNLNPRPIQPSSSTENITQSSSQFYSILKKFRYPADFLSGYTGFLKTKHGLFSMPRLFLLVLAYIVASSTHADPITESVNVIERKVFRSWVAYKTSTPSDCRISQQFVIGSTLATLFVHQAFSPNSHELWSHVYGSYISEANFLIDQQPSAHNAYEFLDQLRKAQELSITASITTDDDRRIHSTRLNLEGLEAAIAYCGYDVPYSTGR